MRKIRITMADISRSNSLLKSYNRSSESSLPFIPPIQKSYPGITCGKDDACVKQTTNGDCLQPSPASQIRELSEKHVRLDRWIIKPLGDGICVEGHRRLTNFQIFTLMLFTDLCH